MSRVSLDRLAGQRVYRDMLFDSVGGVSSIVAGLPSEWLSDRGLTRSDIAEKLGRVAACLDQVEGTDCGLDRRGRRVIAVRWGNWCRCPSVCSSCSTRLQSSRRARYGDAVRAAVRKYPYRYLLTFTIRDGSDLGERLGHLRQTFRAWYRLGQRRKGGWSRGEYGKIRAMLAGVELKKTGSDWHCHIHALAFADRPLDYRVYDPVRKRALRRRLGRAPTVEELRACVSGWAEVGGVRVPVSKLTREWLAVSGDSVNVSCVPLRGGWIEVQRGALEVLKYSTKLASAGADGRAGADLVALLCATYCRRMFMSFGEFRGSKSEARGAASVGVTDTWLVWSRVNRSYERVRGLSGRVGVSREALSLCGRLLGAYRRGRRAVLDKRGVIVEDVVRELDRLKEGYRAAVGSVWRWYARADFVSRFASGRVECGSSLCFTGPPVPVELTA